MAKKVLVTGAAGLIGREVCKQLSLKFEVISVDNNFRYPDFVPMGTFFKSDLVDFLQSTENDFDYIFHMSAINGTKHFYEIPNQVTKNNIRSDLAVFDFVEKNKNSKLIYASSSEVVADSDQIPTGELIDITVKDIHNPRWSYRFGKIVSENYLMNSHIDFLIIRFFNIFGKDSGSGHFVKDIIDKISNNDFTLYGGDETRSFCRVEDAVDALLHVFDKASKDVINIGSSEELTVLEAASIISQHKNLEVTWKSLPGKQGSVKRRNPSLDKLLDYYPSYSPKKFKDAINDL